MRPHDADNFDIPEPLWRVLQECETICVGGCCGREAFVFDPKVIRNWITVSTVEHLSKARWQLDELIAMLETVPGPVETMMITDRWTGHEAASWFAKFRRAFDEGSDETVERE